MPAVVLHGDRRQAALAIQPPAELDDKLVQRSGPLPCIGTAHLAHVFLLLTGPKPSTTRQAQHDPHREGYAASATPTRTADQHKHRSAHPDVGISETSA